jgi:DNA-binding beta-propeller fold protein YncE
MKRFIREAVLRHLPSAATALCMSVFALSASAQTSTTILQQSFASGLGGFTSAGSVSTSSSGARMTAALLSTDGAITSSPISTVGLSNLSLTFTRQTTGLDTGEAGIAEVSVNGGAFTPISSSTNALSATTTVALPASAANQTSIQLRFRVDANSSTESFTVSSLTLTGTTGGTGGGGCTTNCNATLPARGNFATFESGHVRPMALSSNGLRLYVVNTPDNRVEVYNTQSGTPVLVESIPVGLEPVALALASDGQLWVVNHLSDSVSVVDVSVSPARVVNTLLVGDEPRDILFAGTGNKWAFITTAHRGQNTGFDPQLTTPGIGRADVWVFDRNNLGTRLGGQAATRLNMFGDVPRALAKNAAGTRVYAAIFHSGNKTSVLTDDIGEGGITKPPPTTDAGGITQPQTGLIVQKGADGRWRDNGDPKTGTAPRDWTSRMRLNLPDYDVFTIDTSGTLPTITTRTSGVGTTLFNMAVNPVNGKVYVSNQEARNVVRFEGPGSRSSTVRGHFVESRITVIDGTSVLPRHLNKHITSYDQATGTTAEKAASLATPLEMAVSPDGATLYLAAMGSNKLARFSTSQLEGNTFTPSATSHLTLTGGLPTGVVLDPTRNLAFVTTRGDNGISVVNTSTWAETAHVTMFNPEPAIVKNGRRFMYDANYTSSRGDSSCSGCHIFGDVDHLAWDLGNPDERRVSSPNTYNSNVPAFGRQASFHPMKGPMTTQSFRGMKGQGPLHWRGDRTGQSRSAGETLEHQAFEDFNVAFTGLLGRASQLTASEMAAFADFALEIVYPPNPIGNLDGSWTSVQATGLNLYTTTTSDTITNCTGCHRFAPAEGRFGTDGTMSIEGNGTDEDFKIPHLRNMYTKVGMFAENTQVTSQPNLGDQIRGFGFDNAGASGTITEFLSAPVFTFSATQRAQVEQFVLAMPSEMANIVGQQVTVTPTNATQADVTARLNLLTARARVTSPRKECEVVAKAVISNVSRGWVYNGSSFVPDKSGEAAVSQADLVNQAVSAGAPITFTCVPPGNGTRIGVDRDNNGTLDRV